VAHKLEILETCSEFRVEGSELRVQGLGFRFRILLPLALPAFMGFRSGLGFRVFYLLRFRPSWASGQVCDDRAWQKDPPAV
jgi:hypothetical protein